MILMKKQLIIFGLLVILTISSLSGCLENNEKSNGTNKNLTDEEKIIGTWQAPGYQPLTYYSNGTFSQGIGGGTYHFKDELLIMNWTGFSYGRKYYYSFSEDGNTLTEIFVDNQNITYVMTRLSY